MNRAALASIYLLGRHLGENRSRVNMRGDLSGATQKEARITIEKSVV